MSERLFDFDPSKYADAFARDGYVHIRRGITQDFYDKAMRQIEQSMKTKLMKEFAIGDKQQAMYEFPEGHDYVQDVCQTVGTVCGLNPGDIVLSERHVKGYDADAAPEPNAHKDRYASQISVGLSMHVREGSTLVLYPQTETDINPFNTSVQLRASLSPDRYPEPILKRGPAVEIKDQARDVIIFRGHKFWHLRRNPALTTMLYLKLNAFNCDPMGEDPRTEAFRRRTLEAADLPDERLEQMVVQIGRRVDYIHRHYTRDWQEGPGVVLWGEKHFTIDEDELKALRAIDGKRSARTIGEAMAEETSRSARLGKLRRLARRGVIDLIPPGNPL